MPCYLPDEASTQALGKALAHIVQAPCWIYLSGELGAGKTTLIRAFLREKGITGAIKSPTFSIVEPYELGDTQLFHFDLYRLADEEELDFIGLRDYLNDNSICLVEWPEKGGDSLPKPDLLLNLSLTKTGRSVDYDLTSPRGKTLQKSLEAALQNL